jgi:hypothetical protein
VLPFVRQFHVDTVQHSTIVGRHPIDKTRHETTDDVRLTSVIY